MKATSLAFGSHFMSRTQTKYSDYMSAYSSDSVKNRGMVDTCEVIGKFESEKIMLALNFPFSPSAAGFLGAMQIPVRHPGQRSASETPLNADSICIPQPAQDAFPQLLHETWAALIYISLLTEPKARSTYLLHKTTCRSCGKATWSGCGMHIESALRGVPESDRCLGWRQGRCTTLTTKLAGGNGENTQSDASKNNGSCVVS
eukprot:gene957-1858_t